MFTVCSLINSGMKRLILILLLLVCGVAYGEKVDLVCEGVIECPAGCWGSKTNLNLELKGLVTIDRPIIHMDFEPMWGEWIIRKEDDSKVFFQRNISDVEMVGSLHRYTGELITHNQSYFEKDGTRTAHVNMLCKTGGKMF